MARAAAPETDADIPHPRAAHLLFGHNDAERTMLNAYRGGRFPHAWLIGGAPGIGKATLGFRLARFVLAHPNPASPEVQAAASLNVPADHGVARRILALAHPDLLILERTLNDSGKLRSVIQVDEVRRIVSFFGSTAGEGGWRVCIVDSVEDLNAAGANALLKMLEEPPARALFILISHAPGRVLPTIRSRCRRLILRPLSSPDVLAALQAITGRGDPELATAAAAGEGSIGRALALLDADALALRERLSALLEKLPDLDFAALHRLGDQLGRADEEAFETFVDRVQEWLSAQIAIPAQDLARLNEIAQIWDKIATATRDVEIYNLERKPLVFNVFGLLAEAART